MKDVVEQILTAIAVSAGVALCTYIARLLRTELLPWLRDLIAAKTDAETERQIWQIVTQAVLSAEGQRLRTIAEGAAFDAAEYAMAFAFGLLKQYGIDVDGDELAKRIRAALVAQLGGTLAPPLLAGLDFPSPGNTIEIVTGAGGGGGGGIEASRIWI